MRLLIVLIFVVTFGHVSSCNVYSEESNLPQKYKTMYKPFRMAKINLLWEKAQKILTEVKLQTLHSELVVQDKQEMIIKKLKTEAGDKAGLKEAELRKKLRGIMNQYNLMQHFEDVQSVKNSQNKAFIEANEEALTKSMFKDKKLNKLWYKAEQSGLTELELKGLKEEFLHHQEKIDQYYQLMEEKQKHKIIDQQGLESDVRKFQKFDELKEPVSVLDHTNNLRDKHREIKDGYDAILKKTNKSFTEPRVDGLWKLARGADFTEEELDSLRVELSHYEQRLMKLRHLQAEIALADNRYPEQDYESSEGEGKKWRRDQLNDRERRVEKLHDHLEKKILQRHLEL